MHAFDTHLRHPAASSLVSPACEARGGVSLGVQGSGCRFQGAGFRVQGSGCRVQGAGFRVQGTCGTPPRHPWSARPANGFGGSGASTPPHSALILCRDSQGRPWSARPANHGGGEFGSEFPITCSYSHVCSAMIGVPHRPLLPSPLTVIAGCITSPRGNTSIFLKALYLQAKAGI